MTDFKQFADGGRQYVVAEANNMCTMSNRNVGFVVGIGVGKWAIYRSMLEKCCLDNVRNGVHDFSCNTLFSWKLAK